MPARIVPQFALDSVGGGSESVRFEAYIGRWTLSGTEEASYLAMHALPGRGPERPDAVARARVAALVARHHRSLLRVAMHWSATPDDAQDAVQRALEIYLRRVASLDP